MTLFLLQFLSYSILSSGNPTAINQSDSPIKAINNAEISVLSHYGNGTLSNPYIIENLAISGAGWAITLENIDVFVTIRNCNFKNSGGGINLYYCENINIVNNTFLALNSYGIKGYFAYNLTISENDFVDCAGAGIYFYVDNKGHNVNNNRFYSCGIDIVGGFGYNNIFENNLVNDKQLIVVLSQSGVNFDSRSDIGELIFINSQNCQVSNSIFEDSTPLIVIKNSDFIDIINCTIRSSYSIGLRIDSADNIKVRECQFYDMGTALKANYCHNANITNNYFLNSNFGINAAQVWDYSINNNTIFDSKTVGIVVYYGYSGNTISNNKVGYCGLFCIDLSSNEDSEILDNSLINDKDQFIRVSEVINSTFDGNIEYIIDNSIITTPSETYESYELNLTLKWKSGIFVKEYVIYINGEEELRCNSTTNNATLELIGNGVYNIEIKTVSTLYSYVYDKYNSITITLYDPSYESEEDTVEVFFTSFDSSLMLLALFILFKRIKIRRN